MLIISLQGDGAVEIAEGTKHNKHNINNIQNIHNEITQTTKIGIL